MEPQNHSQPMISGYLLGSGGDVSQPGAGRQTLTGSHKQDLHDAVHTRQGLDLLSEA